MRGEADVRHGEARCVWPRWACGDSPLLHAQVHAQAHVHVHVHDMWPTEHDLDDKAVDACRLGRARELLGLRQARFVKAWHDGDKRKPARGLQHHHIIDTSRRLYLGGDGS